MTEAIVNKWKESFLPLYNFNQREIECITPCCESFINTINKLTTNITLYTTYCSLKCEKFNDLNAAMHKYKDDKVLIWFTEIDKYAIMTPQEYCNYMKKIAEKNEDGENIICSPKQIILSTSQQKLVIVIDNINIDYIKTYAHECFQAKISLQSLDDSTVEMIFNKPIAKNSKEIWELYQQFFDYVYQLNQDLALQMHPIRLFPMGNMHYSVCGLIPSSDLSRVSNRLVQNISTGQLNEAVFTKNTNIPIKNISKSEKLTHQALVQLFPNNEFIKIRPTWLKNPKTNHKLELDFFCEELSIAIEVDGAQHHHEIKYFHPSPEHFHYQVERDMFKDSACAMNGVKLIRIPHTINTLEGITNLISENR